MTRNEKISFSLRIVDLFAVRKQSFFPCVVFVGKMKMMMMMMTTTGEKEEVVTHKKVIKIPLQLKLCFSLRKLSRFNKWIKFETRFMQIIPIPKNEPWPNQPTIVGGSFFLVSHSNLALKSLQRTNHWWMAARTQCRFATVWSSSLCFHGGLFDSISTISLYTTTLPAMLRVELVRAFISFLFLLFLAGLFFHFIDPMPLSYWGQNQS